MRRCHRRDIEAALRLPAGSVVAADRAYVDFEWIDSLISQGVFIVTRLKKRIRYRVVARGDADRTQGVTSDQTIELTSAWGRRRCPHRLRRIDYRDPGTGKRYVYLTTNFELSAKTVADIYKSRWQVELFFKWIKQNLKVKRFVGTTRNAVMTQLWIAACMYLLVCYVKFLSRRGWRLVEFLRLLQLNLFERRPSTTCSAERRRPRRHARCRPGCCSPEVNGTAMVAHGLLGVRRDMGKPPPNPCFRTAPSPVPTEVAGRERHQIPIAFGANARRRLSLTHALAGDF